MERDCLTRLYETLRGSTWCHTDNWCSELELCKWYGVHCDEHGHVVRLELRDNNLQGVVLEALWEYLEHLKAIDLRYNNALTVRVPHSIDTHPTLEGIQLPERCAGKLAIIIQRYDGQLRRARRDPQWKIYVTLETLHRRYKNYDDTSLLIPDTITVNTLGNLSYSEKICQALDSATRGRTSAIVRRINAGGRFFQFKHYSELNTLMPPGATLVVAQLENSSGRLIPVNTIKEELAFFCKSVSGAKKNGCTPVAFVFTHKGGKRSWELQAHIEGLQFAGMLECEPEVFILNMASLAVLPLLSWLKHQHKRLVIQEEPVQRHVLHVTRAIEELKDKNPHPSIRDMFDELQRRASDDERNLTQERRLQEFLVGTLSQEDIGDLHTDVPSVLLERALRPYQDRREVIEAFDRSRLFFLHVIGTGAFARVDLALYDLRLVAVKKLNPISDEERTVVQNEIELHRKLQCRTLLRMYGTYESRDGVDVHLVLEYAHYGSLRGVYKGTHLAERPWKKMRGVDGDVDVDVSLEQRVRYLRDVLEAVSYLHGERVFHRDIKCDNVLIREDMTALLGDLGLSRQLSASQSRASSKEVGTPVFRAPEVNASTPDGYKCSADIYSIGITIMELLLSEIPPNPTEGQEHLQRLRTECPGLAFPLEQLRRIAMHCTVVAPEDRPCADQVLQWLSVDLYNVEIPTH